MNDKNEKEIEVTDTSALTQLLGVALRGVLPYAENEVGSLGDAHKNDGDESLKHEYERGGICIQRAHAALNVLGSTSLTVKDVDDSAFDDTFKITFDKPDE